MATALPPSYVAEWKRTTPPAIQSAVEFLRKAFRDRVFVAKFSTRGWCFHALHPDASKDFERLLKPGIFSDYLDSLLPENSNIPEPAIFQQYFYACADLIAPNVRATFLELLGIALAHQQSLKCAPVEWASLQMNLLIEGESSSIGMWAKHACDEQDNDGLDDEAVYWNSWRAPRWLFMKPFANSPYDRARAWERKDESETQHVLRVIRDRFNRRLTIELEKQVGEGRVKLAQGKLSYSATPAVNLGLDPTRSGVRAHQTPETAEPAVNLASAAHQTRPRPENALRSRTEAGVRSYRSKLKRHIRNCLTDNPQATDCDVCGCIDEQGIDEALLKSWLKPGIRELTVAYRTNPELRNRIASTISKVRRDMGLQKAL